MLLGRESERRRIERLLNDARQSRSGTLVIRGEAGIGKTMLLRYALDLGEAMTVVTATGIEAEAELEYSGLLELTRPLLYLLEDLPSRQADALREALGLANPQRRDRFAVAAALLGLLAAAAEERPLLVLVDDAHWLDRASADALRFASRRLHADRVAFLLAIREDEDDGFDTAGLDELELEGLGPEDVGELLERSGGAGGLDRDTLERVCEATGGNPLALLEVSGQLSPEELAAWHGGPEPLPVGAAVRSAYARRAEHLPVNTRTALLVAALADPPEVETIGRALAGLGLELAALEPAEDDGLVVLEDGMVTFRHPLVRSALHDAGAISERRRAHAALAEALAAETNADRRAWHQAAATVGPDAVVAAALDSVAVRSLERGGHAAAGAALERAALLTPDKTARVERLVRAADARWAGGSTRDAIRLLERAMSSCDDEKSRYRTLALRGWIELDAGVESAARDMLLEAATLAERHDPPAVPWLLELAANAMFFGGDILGSLSAAERVRALTPREGGLLDGRADLVLGWALSHAGRANDAQVVLTRAVELLLADTTDDSVRLRSARLALDILERDADGDQLTARIIDVARSDGPVALLRALEQITRFDVRAGRWQRAVASAEEGLEIADALGHGFDTTSLLVLLARVDAARGEEDSCRHKLGRAVEVAKAHGLVRLEDEEVVSVRGLLELGLGELRTASQTLEGVARTSEQRGLFARDVTPEPDLVEALYAQGRADEARAWLDAFSARASRASPRWGAALVARCRGMLAADEFDGFFLEALDLHQTVPDRFQEARTLLAFGERLRRAGRRIDARPQLRAALEAFEQLEATPWIKRTRRELRATGEKLGRRAAAPGEDLTPQELQVALQVAEGKTNKEVGAALFLSSKTVEFHLARVYRKLDISSRAELIRRFASEPALGLIALPS